MPEISSPLAASCEELQDWLLEIGKGMAQRGRHGATGARTRHVPFPPYPERDVVVEQQGVHSVEEVSVSGNRVALRFGQPQFIFQS